MTIQSTTDHLIALEHSLLDPAVRSDGQRLTALFADDFTEFGASGTIYTKHENMLVEVSGALLTVQNFAAINLYINDRFYRLADLATIRHGYATPPQKMFRVNGKPAIGIGISMRTGGDNLAFGENLTKVAGQLRDRFPIGIELQQVADQSTVVRDSIAGFTSALGEAIGIVLIVSFVSLGLRSGLVVALSIRWCSSSC